MKNKFVFAAIISLLAQVIWARESWPEPTPEAVAQARAFNQHEQEVISNDAPQIAEWTKKGKPAILSAGKSDDLPQATVPAFPGAEGGGMHAFGGRGGKVYVVTNLNDSGPGSFREGCEAAGPRVVIFNVSGIIHLQMPVFVDAPYLTIDGHTAPGDGVCIAGQSTLINTHDVVVRYLRFRRGISDIFNRDDSLGGNPVGNIIVDHCSCSWGGDESISMYRHMYQPADGSEELKLPTVNITIQWCIISETLNTFNHALGGTWGGRNTGFNHNLFADNAGRNPSIGMRYDFNFVNNVLFNYGGRTVDGGDDGSFYNIINNYYQPGPATPTSAIRHRILRPDPARQRKGLPPIYGRAYVAGNYIADNPAVTADNWNGGVQFENLGTNSPDTLLAGLRADKPFPMAPMTIQSAQDAYQSVLAGAGATLPVRDPVDHRIVEEVKTGKVWGEGLHIKADVKPMKRLVKNDIGDAGNGIITDVSQVGGYPEYKGEPIKDLCADGIPLSWKKKYNLDVNDLDLSGKDLQGDGYTVMDKYIAGLDPTKKIDWSDPKSNVNTLP